MGSLTQRIRRDVAALAAAAQPIWLYRCDTCNKTTVTIQLDSGVLPETIGCRAARDCVGRATVRPEPGDTRRDGRPRWEWYLPDPATRKQHRKAKTSVWPHIQRGGLLIRRRG